MQCLPPLHVSAMRPVQALLVGLGSLVVIAGALLIWRIVELPIQPAHVTVARVVAVTPTGFGGTRPPRTRVAVRNAHGTGQFVFLDSDVRCEVGQDVKVEQRGVTLTPLPATCR